MSTKKYLDKDGLSYFWGKVKNEIPTEEVAISTTQPTGNETIWIDPSSSSNIGGLELDKIYPIGSIYINTTGTNPGSFLGGTWQSFGAGKVLVGQDTSDSDFDTLGETGGSKYLQEHMHTYEIRNCVYLKGETGLDAPYYPAGTGWNDTNVWATSTAGTGNSGNLQPYIVVSMWVRTA